MNFQFPTNLISEPVTEECIRLEIEEEEKNETQEEDKKCFSNISMVAQRRNNISTSTHFVGSLNSSSCYHHLRLHRAHLESC